jgi:hypothetical protein
MEKKKVNMKLLIGIAILIIAGWILICNYLWGSKNLTTIKAASEIVNKLSYVSVPIPINEEGEKDIKIYMSGHVDYSTMKQIGSELLYNLPITYQKFLDDGGLLVVSSDISSDAKEFYGEDLNEGVQGFYKRSGDIPTIWLSTDFYEIDEVDHINTITAKFFASLDLAYHEMAHYIDEKYGISSRTEFKDYFTKYAANYQERTTDPGYATTNEMEFFAVLYSEMFTWSSNQLQIPEDLYQFMKEVFEETEQISIERNEAILLETSIR